MSKWALFMDPGTLQAKRQDFIAVYDQYADALFRHCYFRVFDTERGAELMQEAFMKTWEYIAADKEIQNVVAFLYRTANNLIIDEIRRRKRRMEKSLDDLQEQGFDIEGENATSLNRAMDLRTVVAIMAQIEEPYRTAVIMRYFDGLSPKDIAEILGETQNVVSVRVNRGVKKIRSFLEPNA